MLRRITNELIQAKYTLFPLEKQELWDTAATYGIVEKIVSGEISKMDLIRMTMHANLSADLIASSTAYTKSVPESNLHRKWEKILRDASQYAQKSPTETEIKTNLDELANFRWNEIVDAIELNPVDVLLVTPEFSDRISKQFVNARKFVYMRGETGK